MSDGDDDDKKIKMTETKGILKEGFKDNLNATHLLQVLFQLIPSPISFCIT